MVLSKTKKIAVLLIYIVILSVFIYLFINWIAPIGPNSNYKPTLNETMLKFKHNLDEMRSYGDWGYFEYSFDNDITKICMENNTMMFYNQKSVYSNFTSDFLKADNLTCFSIDDGRLRVKMVGKGSHTEIFFEDSFE